VKGVQARARGILQHEQRLRSTPIKQDSKGPKRSEALGFLGCLYYCNATFFSFFLSFFPSFFHTLSFLPAFHPLSRLFLLYVMASWLGWKDISSELEDVRPCFERGSKSSSPAQLNLERVFEQNRLRHNQQMKNGAQALELPNPGPPTKGKPRLLLMGQRR
jgi:hypothetical protein